MKRTTTVVIMLFLCIVVSAQPQWISFNKSNNQPQKPDVKVVLSNQQSTVLEIDIPGVLVENISNSDVQFQDVSFLEGSKLNVAGAPAVPYLSEIIAIPNDVTNGGRALKVLESAGLITLKDNAQDSPSVNDIEKYNVDIEIKELAANTIPSVLDDVTAGIVNGNYALDFGLDTEEALFKDTSLDEINYWNLIAAKSTDLEDESKVEVYKNVIDAFQTSETEEVFNDTYGGYFIEVGWDQDLLSK